MSGWLELLERRHPIAVPLLFFVACLAVGLALYVVATA